MEFNLFYNFFKSFEKYYINNLSLLKLILCSFDAKDSSIYTEMSILIRFSGHQYAVKHQILFDYSAAIETDF